MSLEFKTSRKSKKQDALVFKIDDEEYTAIPPKDTALAFLVAANSSNDMGERIKEMLAFFESVLDADSYERLISRMRDQEDTFTVLDATNVLTGLIEEFAGRPTE